MTSATTTALTSPRRRFDVGDFVVHPRHGAGEVVERRSRVVEGSSRDYLEIELKAPSLRIMVPCDATAAVGLRSVVGPRRVREIVEVLEDAPDGTDRNWSARRKHYAATLETGDVLRLAAVIRDLSVRAATVGAADGRARPPPALATGAGVRAVVRPRGRRRARRRVHRRAHRGRLPGARRALVAPAASSTHSGGPGPRLPAPAGAHVPPACERLPCTGRHDPDCAGLCAELTAVTT